MVPAFHDKLSVKINTIAPINGRLEHSRARLVPQGVHVTSRPPRFGLSKQSGLFVQKSAKSCSTKKKEKKTERKLTSKW